MGRREKRRREKARAGEGRQGKVREGERRFEQRREQRARAREQRVELAAGGRIELEAGVLYREALEREVEPRAARAHALRHLGRIVRELGERRRGKAMEGQGR